MAKNKQFKVFDPGLGELGRGISDAQAAELETAAAGVQASVEILNQRIAAADHAAAVLPDAVALLEQAMAIVRVLVGVPPAAAVTTTSTDPQEE